MIYTELTNRAMRIAYDAHAGQVDKCEAPYVFHPFHLAEQMPDEITTCAALLHDAVEDTSVTIDELAAEFPPEVIDALRGRSAARPRRPGPPPREVTEAVRILSSCCTYGDVE